MPDEKNDDLAAGGKLSGRNTSGDSRACTPG